MKEVFVIHTMVGKTNYNTRELETYASGDLDPENMVELVELRKEMCTKYALDHPDQVVLTKEQAIRFGRYRICHDASWNLALVDKCESDRMHNFSDYGWSIPMRTELLAMAYERHPYVEIRCNDNKLRKFLTPEGMTIDQLKRSMSLAIGVAYDHISLAQDGNGEPGDDMLVSEWKTPSTS